MDVSESKTVLFDALLSHKGLQHLVDVSAGLLGNPLFMADMSMQVVFKSSDIGDGMLDYSAEHDLDRQMAAVRQAADAGYLERIYRHDEPVLGSFEGQPRYLSARVRDGIKVVGHIVVVEANRPFGSDDEKLLPIVCQTIAFELRRTLVQKEGSERYAPLLESLLSGASVNEEEARRRFSALGADLPQTMRVLVFRYFDTSRAVSQPYLHAQLDKAFPGSMGMSFADSYVRVVGGEKSEEAVAGRLRSYVYTSGMGVGASRPFSQCDRLAAAFNQGDAALRLSPEQPKGLLVPYDNVAVMHITEMLAGQGFDVNSFAAPLLTALVEADREEQTDYVASLSAYLNCGRNVTKAAQALHVHRNSMYYRVGRIQEIAGVDLEDEQTCFLLQLSLAMMGMGPVGTTWRLE